MWSPNSSTTMQTTPFVSVIVPVFNGGSCLHQCLAALTRSSYPKYEVLVVDDCSTDNSVEVAKAAGATILRTTCRSGPASARNFGAQHARGEILLFVDADVVVQPGTLARVASQFEANPKLAAIFGSYDENPSAKNFLSQYKNLFHHFVHQRSSTDATTFWAGCGAVRRNVFVEVGGFDADRYQEPSIEDIELGYRIHSRGYRILLDKGLQAKHLKEWRLGSLLRADILCRAVPWTKLLLERRENTNDLNLKTTDRVSSGLVGLLIPTLLAAFLKPVFFFLVAGILAALVVLNSTLYTYLLRKKGPLFVIPAFLMHILYYLYSGTAFVLCWCRHVFFRQYRVQ
jgi:glycosyltransferase involved in cell wall biosynthesis